MLEHLVDIRAVPAAGIDGLIISEVREGGQTVVISRYGDAHWNLLPYIHTRNMGAVGIIKFDVDLGNGTLATGGENKGLLAAVKRFLYVRWKVRAPRSGKYVSARTVFNNWRELRVLLRWMAREGVFSFSGLTAERCLDYVRYCQKQKGLGGGTQEHYYEIITTYYDLREYLEDRLPEYPWPNTALSLLVKNGARADRSTREGSTEVIPMRILKLIVARALEYVEHKAARLLYARDKVLAIHNEEYRSIAARYLERHPQGFSSLKRSQKVYLQARTGQRANLKARRWLAENGHPELHALEDELYQLRIACYIICAVFSGMRSAELASLEVGCFVRHKGFDDEDYYWLKGKTYKLEEDPRDVEWMVPRVVGTAVNVAERLSALLREELRSRIVSLEMELSAALLPEPKKGLFHKLSENRKHENSLFLCKDKTIETLAHARTAELLKEFAARSGAIVEASDLAGVKDASKVRIGEPWPLAAHQFRRTFAVLVSRNLMGDVRYLREHLKHWSIDMTLYYTRHEQSYVDDTLVSEIVSERDELQALLLEEWLSSDARLSGGTGRRIVRFRGRDEVKKVEDMREFCRKLGEDVFVRGTGHSWCMCGDSEDSGHCLYDAIRCSSCEDSVIDDTHVQVWRGILKQQIEVLQCPDLGEPSWQRCVDHLREAERILVELGDTVEPYALPERPYAQVR